MTIRSVLVGGRGGRDYGISYTIRCDETWAVQSFSVEDVGGIRLSMRRQDDGWVGADEAHDTRFDGASLIDLAGTPFTNTLAIRALPDQHESTSAAFRVVYVPFDDLAPILDQQRYTVVEPYRSYHYAAVDRSFEVMLPVDRSAIVKDYPGMFRRL